MNLKIKSKKFSISLKIFLLLTFLTYLSIGLSLGANFFYLEKYQISQRKQILLRFAKKYKDVPKDEFIRFLDEEGIFFKEDSVESLKSLAELNPNITTASISKNRFIGIVKGRDKVNRIILIEKTGDNKVIILSSPVASITSIIGVPSGKRGITTLRIFLTIDAPFIFNVFRPFFIQKFSQVI